MLSLALLTHAFHWFTKKKSRFHFLLFLLSIITKRKEPESPKVAGSAQFGWQKQDSGESKLFTPEAVTKLTIQLSMLRPHSYGIYTHHSPKLLLIVCLSDPCHVIMHLQLSKHSAALPLWSMTFRVRIHRVAAIQQPYIVKFYSKFKTDAHTQDGFVIKSRVSILSSLFHLDDMK